MAALATALLLALYTLAGAALLPAPTLLSAAVTGMASWYAVWLAGSAAGIPAPPLFLFWLAAAALLMAKRTYPANIQHHIARALPLLALGLPTLALLNFDTVTRWDELSHYMRNADLLDMLGRLPAAADIARLDWRYPEFPLAWTALWLPASWLSGGAWTPAAWACANWLLLLLVADAMLTLIAPARTILSTALALLAVVAANPFLNPALIASGYVDPALGVATFAAGFPLLRREPLPQGTALLPFSLALVLCVGLKEIGLYLALMIAALWLLRAAMERNNPKSLAATAAILLLPALAAWTLWQLHVGTLHLPATYRVASLTLIHWSWLADCLLNEFKGWWGRPHAVLLLLGYGAALVLALRRRRFSPTVAVPLALALAYTALLALTYLTGFPEGMARAAHSYWRFMGHIQFFLVFGLVAWLLAQTTRLTPSRRRALGWLCLAVVILGQIPAARLLEPPTKPILLAAHATAARWAEHPLAAATCAPKSFDAEQVEMLRYDLRRRTVVKPCA